MTVNGRKDGREKTAAAEKKEYAIVSVSFVQRQK
jgi:hypothetical protein